MRCCKKLSVTCSCNRIGKLCCVVGVVKNCLPSVWTSALALHNLWGWRYEEPVTKASGSHQQWHRNAALPQTSHEITDLSLCQTSHELRHGVCIIKLCVCKVVLLLSLAAEHDSTSQWFWGLMTWSSFFFFFSEAGASDFCLTGIKWLTMLWIAYKKHFRTTLSVPKSIQNRGFSAPANAGCLILQEIFLNIILNPNYSPKFWGVSSVWIMLWSFWLWVLNAAL